MAVEVADTIYDSSFPCTDLPGPEVAFDTNVMVAREYPQGDPVPQRPEDPGKLKVLLTGYRGDAVLDIPEQDKAVRIGPVHDRKKSFNPGFAPAPEVKPVSGKIGFNPEMEISNNQVPLFPGYDQCRAVTDKFHVHNGLTNPFWGW